VSSNATGKKGRKRKKGRNRKEALPSSVRRTRSPRVYSSLARAIPRTLPEVNDSVIAMGGGDGGEWWKASGVGPVCRVGEKCARRARARREGGSVCTGK